MIENTEMTAKRRFYIEEAILILLLILSLMAFGLPIIRPLTAMDTG